MSAPFFRGGYLSVSARGGDSSYVCLGWMEGVGTWEWVSKRSFLCSPLAYHQSLPVKTLPLFSNVCVERGCVSSLFCEENN